MKISKLLKQGFCISFEFFPPKTEEGEKELFENLRKLEAIQPTYVSVTYGAGGTTRDRTHRIVTRIASEEKLNVMAHLACVGHTKGEIKTILEAYHKADVDNILALRGDAPVGSDIRPEEGEMPHAMDLVSLIKNDFDDYFSIGGAVFPERHLESPNWDWEIKHFAEKTRVGLDFAITQLFFDNKYYFDLKERCAKSGVAIPLVPGIMPITNYKQISKFAAMCGATIPAELTNKMSPYEDNNEEIAKIGIEFAVKQCEGLLEAGVPGLHFYTLNKSTATLQIVKALTIKR